MCIEFKTFTAVDDEAKPLKSAIKTSKLYGNSYRNSQHIIYSEAAFATRQIWQRIYFKKIEA